ncbi:MAG: hypothetical protein CSA34_00090 [Desulfobulbus propionicus]|nr:MAG: hypothetical protein CSA34_00090 [Desulfobulbus propionicus]
MILWTQLIFPLIRLLLFICAGLLVANFIEALGWTRKTSIIARPLTRIAHLSPQTGASFSMAFFSGVSANTMLAEAYDQKIISRRELVLANLFNSLPTYFLHLPTTFFMMAPLIKGAAVIYICLTFGAAVLRTCCITVLSHFLLPPAQPGEITQPPTTTPFADAWTKTWKRFTRRIRKIIRFTIPIYTLFFLLNRLDFFTLLEQLMTDHLSILSWLSPQAMSIITLHVVAEFSAGLAAAGALLADGTMSQREVILALLVGNILSSPVRAIRHQFPYYAGIFKPALATRLIFFSQSFRTAGICVVAVLYVLFGSSS